MKSKQQGQALTEFAITLPILGLLMVWGLTYIQGALQEKVQARQMAGIALGHSDERHTYGLNTLDTHYWNFTLRLWINMSKWMTVYAHGDYPFSFATMPLELLARFEGGLDMTNQNMWEVDIAEYGHFEWMRYQRLRDDWSARKPGQLESRPRALTGSALFDNRLVKAMQSALAATPMGRELRPQELIFGHVDADVVPLRALCSETESLANCGYE
ncbi:MAG: hypothetical protein JJU03_13675 [Idiomarina sp.]|nr:hypothetical protein [Idiomarina sp.]